MKAREKRNHHKQMLGGVIYTALAAAVTAVAVGSVASFGNRDKKETVGGTLVQFTQPKEEKRDEKSLVPPVGASSFTLDTPLAGHDTAVSETQKGVSAEIHEPADNVITQAPQTGIPAAKTPVPAKDDVPDRSKPVSEEPEDEPYGDGVSFIRPCGGYVSREYAVTTPIYSPSMADYRTHAGVDIACDIGTPVKAMADGVIESIVEDPMLGTTLVLSHADGVTSVYANLSPDLPVSTVVGKRVSMGDVLAGVGETASCESAEVSHLHLEMLRDGRHVDPEEEWAG